MGKSQQNFSREDLYYEALNNHEPRLQPANPDKGYWLGQSPKLRSTKPNPDSAPDPK